MPRRAKTRKNRMRGGAFADIPPSYERTLYYDHDIIQFNTFVENYVLPFIKAVESQLGVRFENLPYLSTDQYGTMNWSHNDKDFARMYKITPKEKILLQGNPIKYVENMVNKDILDFINNKENRVTVINNQKTYPGIFRYVPKYVVLTRLVNSIQTPVQANLSTPLSIPVRPAVERDQPSVRMYSPVGNDKSLSYRGGKRKTRKHRKL